MIEVPRNPFHTFIFGFFGGGEEKSGQSGQSFEVPFVTVIAHKFIDLLKIKLHFYYIGAISQTVCHPVKTIRSNQCFSQTCKLTHFNSS